jgi:hypothetical protein
MQSSGPVRALSTVRVGMFEYPSVTNVPVMDVAGNPFSDAVTVDVVASDTVTTGP